MINTILDFLFPPKCPFCRDILSGKLPLCPNCLKKLPFANENVCSIPSMAPEESLHNMRVACHGHKAYFKHAFVPLIYKDEAKEAAIALKAGHPFFAKGLAYLLADKILSSVHYTKFDFITFVPQSPRSRRERGYNQAELLAKELSKLLHVKCVSTLIRTNDGKQQHTLNAAERRENVKKCYFKKDMSGSGTVLLVDDIYTTGATANYCSKLLLQMGYKNVYCGIIMVRTGD